MSTPNVDVKIVRSDSRWTIYVLNQSEGKKTDMMVFRPKVNPVGKIIAFLRGISYGIQSEAGEMPTYTVRIDSEDFHTAEALAQAESLQEELRALLENSLIGDEDE